ncbi:MAG: hypothetical protein ACOC1F_02775 [Myxococcota bacterium]
MLEAIVRAGVPVFIVTNSDGKLVDARLDALRLRGRQQVCVMGGAAKFQICEPSCFDVAFERLSASLRVEGLCRPVLLRRERYYDRLIELWRRSGQQAVRTLVCGDSFEIDLALPAALGCQTLLVTRDETPAYERAAVAALPGGDVCETLGAVLQRLP